MARPEVVLVMMRGSVGFSRRCIPLETDEALVGRATELNTKSLSNAFFDTGVVSRKHGVLYYQDGRFYYKDTNSLNGSWINGVKMEATKEQMLANNDSIQCRGSRLNKREIHRKI